MDLLNKLQTQGSNLTNLDGGTPEKFSGASNYPKGLAASQLDLSSSNPSSAARRSPA